MVRKQLAARGISDRRVRAVMAWVPRELFVPDESKGSAYADTPLPIPHAQTISQPYIVGLMTQHLRIGRRSKVLEIGTGSGYHTAILAKITGHVWSVERVKEFMPTVRKRLDRLGITNVTLIAGDGAAGYAPGAPYDAILVAAAAPSVPPALIEQLNLDGRLIIPLGGRDVQILTVIHNAPEGRRVTSLGECRFVPFVTDAHTD